MESSTAARLEPATHRLLVFNSTDWASRINVVKIFTYNIIDKTAFSLFISKGSKSHNGGSHSP